MDVAVTAEAAPKLQKNALRSGFGHSVRVLVSLPIETNFESGTSQSKSGTSVNLSNCGFRVWG